MKTILKVVVTGALVAFVASAGWWIVTAPAEHHAIGPAYAMQPTADTIESVRAPGDAIGDALESLALEIPGYDDIVLQEHLGRGFVTAQDGWIWKLDLTTGAAERYVKVPLMPAGAHELPGDDDTICFCGMYLAGAEHDPNDKVGLYAFDVNSREVTPLLQRVPLPPAIRAAGTGEVYATSSQTPLAVSEMNDSNSRPLMFCNDVDISTDGKRFYVSEPFAYEGASMGGGAFFEAITLGNNGRLWKLDTESDSVALVAQDYTFIDGVLLEEGADGVEQSVIVSETVKFKLTRFHLAGPRAGEDEVLWEALPGMPDGLERDPAGNIWIGLIAQRSEVVTWIHANPWIKPLMLRVPPSQLPISPFTGVLALSPDATRPLWFAEHPGGKIQSIAAVIPGESQLYLASFTPNTPGIHRIPNPLLP